MTPAKRRAATLLASLTLATAAVGGHVAAQSAAPAAERPQGGTIIFGEWQAAAQLNPYLTTAVGDFEAIYPISRGLTTTNDDGVYVADLAAEMPSFDNGGVVADADGDGFTLKVTLKPGLQWSDGAPLTMKDFVANYDWAVKVLKSGTGCANCLTFVPVIDPTVGDPAKQGDPTDFEAKYGADNQYIKSIDLSDDDLTATVTWKKNYAAWQGWMTEQWIAPQYWNDVAMDQVDKTATVGNPDLAKIPVNGPFVITGASADGIDYAPNPNWHATDPSPLEGLRLRWFGSKDGEITAFLNGEIDLALNMTQADYPAIEGVDASIGKAILDQVYQYEHIDIQTQHKDKGLDDVNVRKAIALALDKEAILSVLFPGAELAPACSVAPPNTWWHTDVPCVTQDVDAAKKLLDDAGWVEGTDDTLGPGRFKDGQMLRLTACTTSGNPTRLTTIGLVSQQLSAISIPVDIVTVPGPAQMFAGWEATTPDTACNIYRGNFDIALFTSLLTADVYGNYYYTYDTSQIASDKNPSGANTSHLSNPDMDAALKELGSSIDPAGQKEAASKVQQIVGEQFNELPLYYRAETTGVGSHLGGFVKYNPSTATSLWNVEDWYYQQ
jgi:peptide/nickel transport system substrate-binding protein